MVTQVGMPQANLTAQQLGLGWATADAYNRFSINTPAMLLNHAGNGIEASWTPPETLWFCALRRDSIAMR